MLAHMHMLNGILGYFFIFPHTAYDMDRFGIKTLNAIKKQTNEKNAVISNLGLTMAFMSIAIVASDSKRDLLKEHMPFLSGNSPNFIFMPINPNSPQYKKAIIKNNQHMFNLALTNREIQISSDIEEKFEKFFPAGLIKDDFKSTDFIKTINKWASLVSNEAISTLLSDLNKSLNNSPLHIINAFTFAGHWAQSFDPLMTKSKWFTNEDESTARVSMMRTKRELPFAEFDQFYMVKLDYDFANQHMLIILPKSNQTIKSTLEYLEQSVSINNLTESLKPNKVDLKLPKFNVQSNIDLRKPLESIGLGGLFWNNRVEAIQDRNEYEQTPNPFYSYRFPLNKIIHTIQSNKMKSIQDLTIQEMIHQVEISVNEVQTKATAFTKVSYEVRHVTEWIEFYCDRPFIYMVRENLTPLFVGIFEKAV